MEGETYGTGSLQVGLAGAGGLRWAVADLSEVVEGSRSRLDLSPVAAAALGRSLAGAALLLRLASKTPTRLTVEIVGDGPLGRVIAECDDDGNLRGMVGNRLVDLPATDATGGKLPVGEAVGRGRLRVTREHGERGNYHSQVELVSGEIGQDVAHYLAQSEQRRSAVLLGVLTRPGGVSAAGGMIIEALPDADPEALARLESNLTGVGGISRLIEGEGLEATRDLLLAGLDARVHERRPLRYRCRCSRQRLLSHLVMLPADDRRQLPDEEGGFSAECAFCGAVYRFRGQDLEPTVH